MKNSIERVKLFMEKVISPGINMAIRHIDASITNSCSKFDLFSIDKTT